MKQTGARPLLILVTLTAIGVLAVVLWAASQRNPAPGVHIGRAVSITRPHASAYAVGAAFRHFATATISQSCGAPTSGVAWNGSSATQQFAPNCTAHARFRLTTPTPQPQPTGPAPTATTVRSTPTVAPRPTGTPLPAPSATSGPTAFLLSLINTTRSTYGRAPLVESAQQDQCALQHSIHMQSVGYISHDQFPADICLPGWTAAGENVGNAGGSENSAIQAIHTLMMNELHDAATCASTTNHACSIISPTYRTVGLGIYYVNNIVWVTEDFTAP